MKAKSRIRREAGRQISLPKAVFGFGSQITILILLLGLVIRWTLSTSEDAKQYFNFPDSESLYFKKNVEGLVYHINRAINTCPSVSESLSKSGQKIDIIFESQTAPINQKYIQFQMEQLGSQVFNDAYINKLGRAYQVWDFSHRTAEVLSSELNLSNVFYVPMMLTYTPNINSKREKSLGKIVSRDPDVSTELITYIGSCYIWWKHVSGNIFEANQMRDSFCGISNDCILSRSLYRDFDQPIEILIFGYLSCSHNNIRERVCTMLESEGFKVLCLHQVFGSLLNYFINKAEIILNVEYYENASLATHRIDPLILTGKTVMSFTSKDALLDNLYHPVVHFTNETNLIRDLNDLLHTENGRLNRRSSKMIQTYAQDVLANIEPLCSALMML